MRPFGFTLPVLLLCLSVLTIPADVDAQNCTLFEDFSGTLDAWTAFGSPPSYIDLSIGNPAPCLQINGDASYPSGLNTAQTFSYSDGLSIRFQLKFSGPVGQSFTDGAVGYGVGGATDAQDAWHAAISHRTDGRFELVFAEDTPLQAVFVTEFAITDRWVPCEIRIRPSGYVDYYIESVRVWTSPNALDQSQNNAHVFIEGRQHYVDNVCVDVLNVPPHCVFPPVSGCDFGEAFDDLAQWTLFGSPLPDVDPGVGNPAPAAQFNGDSSYPSGGNTVQTFDFTSGMSIRFEMMYGGPIGPDFTDGGVGYGYGGETDAIDSMVAALWQRNDGRFEFVFMEDTPQQATFVTSYGVPTDRWVPCEIRIDVNRYVHYLVDCQILWTSPSPLPPETNHQHVFFEGRRHLVDNICVDWFGPVPVQETTWGRLKTRYH